MAYASALILCATLARAQSTQGTISGRVVDSLTGLTIGSATVRCVNLESGQESAAAGDGAGNFALPLLSPGPYRLRILARGYQTREMYGLELAVAGHVSIVFRMRPVTDLWESKQQRNIVDPRSNRVYQFYGPDMDPNGIAILAVDSPEATNPDSSASYVIGARLIRDLPLEGRDVYSLLSVLPAVTTDTATGRGIDVAVAGQRPSSSNFLLDGVENNNYLVTGPLAAVNPDGIQEYRISTNNYAAEYGRTGSFIANAITRAGSNRWRGAAWAYFGNEVLDANGFQENWKGLARAPVRQWIPGAMAGGPVWKERLFASASFESQRFRSRRDPTNFVLPTQAFARGLPDSSPASTILKPFAAILPADATTDRVVVQTSAPAAIDQTSALLRADYLSKSGKQRLTGRVGVFAVSEPDLVYSPYPGYSAGIAQRASSATGAWTAGVLPWLTNEVRASRIGERYGFDRPHGEVPYLSTNDQVMLPGSRLFASQDIRDRTVEALDNLTAVLGKHLVKAGAGWLGRSIDSTLAAEAAGTLNFSSLANFGKSTPSSLLLSFNASGDLAATPDFARRYAYGQTYGFVEDSYSPWRRLTLTAGVRFEYFGNPRNTGAAKDRLIAFGSGASLTEQLAGAQFATAAAGDQAVYRGPGANWAGRFGFALALPVGLALRGGYGVYFDRPFDNDWENVATNSLQTGFSTIGQPIDFLKSPRTIAVNYPPSFFQTIEPVAFQNGLRAASIQSSFLSMERKAGSWASLQLLGISTLGRRLVTTDQINRINSVDLGLNPDGTPKNPSGAFNPKLPSPLDYRANQGQSQYVGGAAVARFRGRLLEGQASYTWSHAIDNQSDPLTGTFFNFNAGSTLTAPGAPAIASFTKQFDWGGDRANADFDQRQDLVLSGVAESPALGRSRAARAAAHWRLGIVAAVRSGFPFSAFAKPPAFLLSDQAVVENNRASLAGAGDGRVDSSIPGGLALLNQGAFVNPAPGSVGNTGRNAFAGPGFFNLDASLARSFALPKLGESRQLTVRVNAFNVLNHANLNNPVYAQCCSGSFGYAFYGRVEASNGFPLLQPLVEGARQVQLMVRFDF